MAPVIYGTGRLTVRYNTARLAHECSFFQRTGVSQSLVIASVRTFLQACAPFILATTIFSDARWQDGGQNFSLPVSWDPIPGAAGGTIPRDLEPLFISFRRRSTQGVQTGIQIFGIALPLTDNYRYTPGENADVDTALVAWNDLGGACGDHNGFGATTYNYANTGVHAYWQRQLRKL